MVESGDQVNEWTFRVFTCDPVLSARDTDLAFLHHAYSFLESTSRIKVELSIVGHALPTS